MNNYDKFHIWKKTVDIFNKYGLTYLIKAATI